MARKALWADDVCFDLFGYPALSALIALLGEETSTMSQILTYQIQDTRVYFEHPLIQPAMT